MPLVRFKRGEDVLEGLQGFRESIEYLGDGQVRRVRHRVDSALRGIVGLDAATET
jgi:hypothetical protein